MRTGCICWGVPAPTGVGRALPSAGLGRAGGVGSYPRGARGIRLRGLLHVPILPIAHSTPAAGGRSSRALESVWMHAAAWRCGYLADSSDLATGADSSRALESIASCSSGESLSLCGTGPVTLLYGLEHEQAKVLLVLRMQHATAWQLLKLLPSRPEPPHVDREIYLVWQAALGW